ncbi:MAG: hypothetical protein EXX96DRAFT_626415 [Benjaminiella poitrasii]|nr:MAG: hypothetical protein EXX96DRAFT_626415 [Benjaminiella poitrasii]
MMNQSKVTKWMNLSSEILYKLYFDYDLPDKTLLECQHVCRNWYKQTQKLCYEHISLESKGKLDAFLQGLAIKPISLNPSLQVKSVFISHCVLDNDDDKLTEVVGMIARRCKNIEALTIHPPTKRFWKTVAIFRILGYLQNLQKITPPYEWSHITTYRIAANALQSTLTHLALCDRLGRREPRQSRDFDELARLLYAFRSLKTLSVMTTTTRETGNFIDLEKRVLSQPSLPPIERLVYETFTEDRDASSTDGLLFETITPCESLKTLTAHTFINHYSALDYIIHKFPALTYLDLNTACDCTTQRMLYNDNDHWLRLPDTLLLPFVYYLLNLNRFFVRLRVSNAEEFVTRLLWTARTTSRRTLVIVFGPHPAHQLILSPLLLEKASDDEICVTYRIHQGTSLADAHLLHIMTELGPYVDHLRLEFDTPTVLNARSTLELVFDSFTRLQHLELRRADFQLDSSFIGISRTITHLTLDECVSSDTLCRDVSARLPALELISVIELALGEPLQHLVYDAARCRLREFRFRLKAESCRREVSGLAFHWECPGKTGQAYYGGSDLVMASGSSSSQDHPSLLHFKVVCRELGTFRIHYFNLKGSFKLDEGL